MPCSIPSLGKFKQHTLWADFQGIKVFWVQVTRIVPRGCGRHRGRPTEFLRCGDGAVSWRRLYTCWRWVRCLVLDVGFCSTGFWDRLFRGLYNSSLDDCMGMGCCCLAVKSVSARESFVKKTKQRMVQYATCRRECRDYLHTSRIDESLCSRWRFLMMNRLDLEFQKILFVEFESLCR
jgi:hypothetical protein